MDFSRPDNARKINRLKVLSALRHDNLSKADLSRKLGINKVSIGEIIDLMVKEGLLEETGRMTAPAGRPATLMSVKAASARALAVEIKRKAVSVAVSDAKDRILRFERFPRTSEMMEDLRRTIAKMKGPEDTGFQGAAVVTEEDIDLSSLIGAPVIRLSRIQAEAASEMARLEDPEDMLFVSWSDNIEAAICHGGLITLPQFAHIRAQRDGECSCGGKGCIGAVASGMALLAKTGAKGYRDMLSNEAYHETIKECLRPMAAALSMAVQALSAKSVMITGEMAGLSDSAFAYLQTLLSSALPPHRKDVVVYRSQGGEKAGREGAVIAALDEFFYHTDLLKRLDAIERISSGFQTGI